MPRTHPLIVKSARDPSLTYAIDAQISPDVAGGTETALLSLISAIGQLETDERFVLIGLKGHGEKLLPFMGPNQTLKIWPSHYVWYVPGGNNHMPMNQAWRRLREALGPFGELASEAHRLYQGLRRRSPKPMSRVQADAQLRPHRASVVHFPYPLHFPTRLPFVYEPWGLPHLHFPQFFNNPGEPEWIEGVFRGGCEDAAMIVTATRWVKHDIVQKYRIPPDKIAVIPRLPQPAGGARPLAPERDHATPVRPDLPREFALFPAMTWPTKNHVGLLRALARLRDAHGTTLHVVCTGRIDRAHWPAIQAEMESLRLGNQVHFLGSVPTGELHRLFDSARFLIFPSLFEGLGLPVIEAFQHRLPVVASTATCIPEVVGDAGILFDARKDEAIVEALLTAIRNPGLLEDLRSRGAARLNGFSQAKMAKMFITCYRRAARAPLSEEQRSLLAEMLAP